MAISKPKYVINRETQEVYPYRDRLLERPEFAPFYDAPPPIDRATGLCIVREKPDPLISAVDDRKKTAAQADAEMRHKMLVDCMMKLPKGDFVTANDMPKLTVLEKAVGFAPTKEERELAFAEYKKAKEASGA